MNRVTAFIMALTLMFSSTILTTKVKASEKPLVIIGYSGKFEASVTQQMRGSLAFDLNMEIQANEAADVAIFSLSEKGFDCNLVEVDGKKIQHSFKGQEITLNFPSTLEKGMHKVRLVYKYLIYENPDRNLLDKLNMNLYADKLHFHCFGGWFPILKGYEFDGPVSFNMDVIIQSDWHLMGSWVPQQYRERPKADGKYRLSRTYPSPYDAKFIGGLYDVTRGGDENMKLWIYTPKGRPNDAQYIAEIGKLANDFYTEWFQNEGSGEVFITGLLCYYLGAQPFDGGYSIDHTLLNRLNFTPDFLAREMAKGWWGGLISSDKESDKRFLEDSMSTFSMYEFLEKVIHPTYFTLINKARLEFFWKSHFPGEPAITDPKFSTNDFLVNSKGSLVVKALMGYMGKDKFTQALEAFIDRYNIKENPKQDKPTLKEFKAQMEASFGGSIDEFWNIFFESGKVPVPVMDVERTDANGGPVKEKIHLRNLEETEYPIKYRIYKVDGKYEDLTFKGEETDKSIEGGIAGIDNVNFASIIPKPDAIGHTMGTGTIASTLAWEKPSIFCLNPESMDRAQQWANLTGQKVLTQKLEIFPRTPIICVGPDAISHYALRSTALLPIKSTGVQLVWLQDEVAGDYSQIMQFPCNENYKLPMIIDTGSGNLPKDLSWTGILQDRSSQMTFGFRNTVIDEFSPPRLEYVQTGWTTDSQSVPDCRIDLGLQNAIGFKVYYDGFDFDKFEFGKVERKITRQASSQTVYLDLSKAASVLLEKSERYLLQRCPQTFTYSGKSKGYKGPSGLKAPESVAGGNATVTWDDQVKFMYRLDGAGSTSWETGSSLLLNGMTPDRHKLKMVFYHDGILSPLKEFEIVSGAKPPNLQLESRQVQCRDGKIVIKGTTDRDVILDPPATVNPDGSFEIVIEVKDCPKTVTIKAKNRFNLEASETVTVSSGKQVKITMQLGSSQATDESGKSYKLSVPPQRIKGMTYVPMRFIGERLGATILWDNSTKKVTYILGSTKVEIIIGKSEAIVNGKTTKMPGPPVVVGGNTLVPVRFVAEALGARVTWVGETQTIIVEYP